MASASEQVAVVLCGFGVIGIAYWCVLGNVASIGNLPYRWGTWKGIQSAIVAVALFGFGSFGAADAGEGLVVGILGAAFGIAAVGLLGRRRFGVMWLFVLEGMGALSSLARGSDSQGSFIVFILANVFYFWASAVYFSKRVPFMSAGIRP